MITGHDLDINTMYACLAGTQKHVGTSMVEPGHVDECLQILHVLAGGEDKWRERPFVSQSNCFVVPPMKFAEDACRCLEAAARGGMPVLLLSAAQAGATSPAALAGTVVQAVAECLAGLVYINCVVPGAIAIWGPWPFVSDLRTGAMSGGSGEQALITSGCAQMGHFYNLTVGSAAGMCDSKLPDMQAGYEKGVTAGISAMTGINLLYESAGMHASLLGFCLESLLIDNDMLGSINRNVRGIEVNEDTLSLEVIAQVCIDGPGHYLGNEQTLALMQKDYVYPQVAEPHEPQGMERGRQARHRGARGGEEARNPVHLLSRLHPAPHRRADPRQARHQAAAQRDGAGRPALGVTPVEHPVLTAIRRAGFTPLGWFAPGPEDKVPDGARFVILIGNAGPDMFRRFARERDPARDTHGRLDAGRRAGLARDLDAEAVYPFDMNPPWPFLTWARRGGGGHVSPLGLNIHPVYGLWHAYRAALLFPVEFDLPPMSPGRSPCEACAAKPCLTACPVSAFDGTSYDVAACAAPPRHGATGRACMSGGCLARHACPVGQGLPMLRHRQSSTCGPSSRARQEA